MVANVGADTYPSGAAVGHSAAADFNQLGFCQGASVMLVEIRKGLAAVLAVVHPEHHSFPGFQNFAFRGVPPQGVIAVVGIIVI